MSSGIFGKGGAPLSCQVAPGGPEDAGAADLLTAKVCTQGEAQSFGGRRRSISWRDRAGVALAEEEPQGMVSRERSSHGFLPDVHEEVRRPGRCLLVSCLTRLRSLSALQAVGDGLLRALRPRTPTGFSRGKVLVFSSMDGQSISLGSLIVRHYIMDAYGS